MRISDLSHKVKSKACLQWAGTINQNKKIMKKINVDLREYEESYVSSCKRLFDEGDSLSNGRGEILGFIDKIPCNVVVMPPNRLLIRCVRRTCITADEHMHWVKSIVRRITGKTCRVTIKGDNAFSFSLLMDECNRNPSYQPIYSFVLDYDEVLVEFHWNQKK